MMLENRLWHEKEVEGEFKKLNYFDCYCPMTCYNYDLIYLLSFDFIVSFQIIRMTFESIFLFHTLTVYFESTTSTLIYYQNTLQTSFQQTIKIKSIFQLLSPVKIIYPIMLKYLERQYFRFLTTNGKL